jgi:hypothetical protein
LPHQSLCQRLLVLFDPDKRGCNRRNIIAFEPAQACPQYRCSLGVLRRGLDSFVGPLDPEAQLESERLGAAPLGKLYQLSRETLEILTLVRWCMTREPPEDVHDLALSALTVALQTFGYSGYFGLVLTTARAGKQGIRWHELASSVLGKLG